ncbi:MAG TPA: polysaccharide deacetylase family protein [Puia sp.]|jgi:peptidoglycan/xylan/chitin deacetylase (PgdA/CDA1 family)
MYVDEYSELLLHKPRKFRDRVRQLALDGLAKGYRFRHSYRELFRIPRVQFLYIHHVFKDEADALDKLLGALSADHQFISHSEGVERILSGDITQPYISISSDDGLKNNLRAAESLHKYGARGCFFICPSIIGEKRLEKLKDFAAERLHFPPVEFLDWKEVDLLLKLGNEIGGHTMSHINIARVPADLLAEEIGNCYEVLKGRYGKALHFAYPYGRFADFSEAGRKLVFDSGFLSCASAQRGCHVINGGKVPGMRDLLIRRDHIVLDWPLEHILYFIAYNAAHASPENNYFTGLCE